MTPEDVLTKAAETITRRGKATGHYEDPVTREVCAYGAMTLAATEGKTSCYSEFDFFLTPRPALLVQQAAELLAKAVPSEFVDEPFAVITWYNDQESTTAEDIALAMKKAAHHG